MSRLIRPFQVRLRIFLILASMQLMPNIPATMGLQGQALPQPNPIDIAPTMAMAGSTTSEANPADMQRERGSDGPRIQSRSMSMGVAFAGSGVREDASFDYSIHTEIRVETSLFRDSGQPQGRSVVPVPFGPTGASMKLSSLTGIGFGYMPDQHGNPDKADPASFDLWFRRSIYPGLHLQLKIPNLLTLTISPLLFLDSPGRFAPESLPFFSAAREATIVRFREGALSTAVAPDRLARRADMHLDFDDWMFGAHLQYAALTETGSSSRSRVLLQESGMQVAYYHRMGRQLLYLAGAGSKGWGYVRGPEAQRSIDAMDGSISAGWKGEWLSTSVFARQTQPSRRHRGEGEDPADRLGWIDTAASPMDLPILGGSSGALLHATPCAPTAQDRCEGFIQSVSTLAYRNAGRYGDITIGAHSGPWRVNARAGILIPSADVLPASPLVKATPYTDIAELALEFGVVSKSGALMLVYSAEYTRTDSDRSRSMNGQSLSAFSRFPVSFEADVSAIQPGDAQ